MSLLDCTAVELAAKIKAGEVTAVEAMQAVVAQIEKSEAELNCYVTLTMKKHYRQQLRLTRISRLESLQDL